MYKYTQIVLFLQLPNWSFFNGVWIPEIVCYGPQSDSVYRYCILESLYNITQLQVARKQTAASEITLKPTRTWQDFDTENNTE